MRRTLFTMTLVLGASLASSGCIDEPGENNAQSGGDPWAADPAIVPGWGNGTLPPGGLHVEARSPTSASGARYEVVVENRAAKDLQQPGTACGLFLAKQQDGSWTIFALHGDNQNEILVDLPSGGLCRREVSGGEFLERTDDDAWRVVEMDPRLHRLVSVAFPPDGDGPREWGWTAFG